MKREDYLKALEIVSGNHTTELVLNQSIDGFVGDLGCSKFTIHIKNCCVSVVDKLKNEGYSLSMCKFGLNVDKY